LGLAVEKNDGDQAQDGPGELDGERERRYRASDQEEAQVQLPYQRY
jgi:hypothetical protein